MFQGLEETQLKGALEALLFVTNEPVSLLTLSDMLEVSPSKVSTALQDLQSDFEAAQRGLELREVASGWRLFTRSEYHELLEKYVLSWDTRKLSAAALETLAVVAYLQPVTRATLTSIRGVNSDSTLNSLIEKGLVKEAGTSDAPGNPMLYATTRTFLEKFGLRTTGDLPDLDQFAPSDEAKQLIEQRLSAHQEEVYVSEEILTSSQTDDVSAADLDRLEFHFEDESEGVSIDDLPAVTEALASSFGLVEKVNFDELTFETDDE